MTAPYPKIRTWFEISNAHITHITHIAFTVNTLNTVNASTETDRQRPKDMSVDRPINPRPPPPAR